MSLPGTSHTTPHSTWHADRVLYGWWLMRFVFSSLPFAYLKGMRRLGGVDLSDTLRVEGKRVVCTVRL